MVYVLNINNEPLMPCKEAKARHLLKQKKAKVIQTIPFIIKLNFVCDNITQPISLGVDAGSKHIGLSATTSEKVLYESDIELRDDISELLATRHSARRTRRLRKTRYRKCRHNNRKHNYPKGWIGPSFKHKIDCHISAIENVKRILPINSICVELASFDIEKIKNLNIYPEDYSKGEQYGYNNLREYILYRDQYTCQYCHGKSKEKKLNIHHIESRKIGGNAPNNLITLCEKCHDDYHKNKIVLTGIKRGRSFKHESFMSTTKEIISNILKDLYPSISFTYGYITKTMRLENNLPKTHNIDARCISGNPKAIPDNKIYYYKKIRRHNRQLYRVSTLKGGIRKVNQCPHELYGYRRYDLVKYNNHLYYVNSRRKKGDFQIKDILDPTFKKDVRYRKLQLIQKSKGYIITYKNTKEKI